MKTIAIFSAYYPPHVGGIESYVFYLSNELVKKGYRVVIVTSNEEHINSVVDEGNKRIIRIPIYNMFSQRYPIPKKNKEYKELIHLLDQENLDHIIVNARFHLTSLIGAKYGKAHNIGVTLIEHGSNHLTVDNKVFDFFGEIVEHVLSWKIRKYVDNYYGVSKAASKWMTHFKVHSSGEWYNSIDTNQNIPKRNKQSIFTFSFAGRLIKQKGIENVLEAYTKTHERFKDTQLVIAGDGNQMNDLIEKYKNDDSIHFVGRLEKKEVLDLLAKTDVFVYPPIWPEGLPTSILEAGLLKVPVISTAQGGIIEIISDMENGIIVQENVDSLYLAMKKLYEDRELGKTMANRLHDDVELKFSWNHTAEKVIKDIFEAD